MLNVGKIEEGFVLDHIQAGKSMSIYEHLGLDKNVILILSISTYLLSSITTSPSTLSKQAKSLRREASSFPKKLRM